MIRILICAAVSLTLATIEAVGQVSLRTVALSGVQAPGLPSGVTYADFIYSQTYGEGSVAFSAQLTGSGVNTSNNIATFAERSEGLSFIVRKGDQAAGLAEGVKYAVVWQPHVNNAGEVAFHASLSGSGITSWNREALFSDVCGNGIEFVARSGNQVDGLPIGIAFETIPSAPDNTLHLNDEGGIALYSTLAVDRPYRGSILRTQSDGNFELLASGLDALPGTPDEVYRTFRELQFNNAGKVAFLTLTSLPDSWSEVLLSDRGDQGISEIARRDEQAPGLPSGVTMQGVQPSSVRLNDAGDVAFAAFLRDDTNQSSSDTAIFRNDLSSNSTVIARWGQQVPGLTAGVLYNGLDDAQSIQLNDEGQVAFITRLLGADVDASNRHAIVRGSSSSDASVVARTGDQAPGLPLGVTFSQFDSSNVKLNNEGTTLFTAWLRDGDSEAQGIFAATLQGEVFPIVSSLQVIDVNDDPQVTDLRQIAGLGDLVLGEEFSDSGVFSFRAQFTNGSRGLFAGQVPTSLPGDYNSDGLVDTADYTVWRDSLNSTTQLAADGDGDGQVDQGDYAVWAQNYGSGHDQSSNAVPEPCAVVMVLTTGLLSTRRRYQGVLTRIPR